MEEIVKSAMTKNLFILSADSIFDLRASCDVEFDTYGAGAVLKEPEFSGAEMVFAVEHNGLFGGEYSQLGHAAQARRIEDFFAKPPNIVFLRPDERNSPHIYRELAERFGRTAKETAVVTASLADLRQGWDACYLCYIPDPLQKLRSFAPGSAS